MILYGFTLILIYIHLYWFYFDLYWFELILHRFIIISHGFMLIPLRFNVLIQVLHVFMSLMKPVRLLQALLFHLKNMSDFLVMSILDFVRIVRITGICVFGPCLKRCAPKKHEFGRYSDIQISHGERIGEQNDGH